MSELHIIDKNLNEVDFHVINEVAADYLNVDIDPDNFVHLDGFPVNFHEWMCSHLKSLETTYFSEAYRLVAIDTDYHALNAEKPLPWGMYLELMLVFHGKGWTIERPDPTILYSITYTTLKGDVIQVYAHSVANGKKVLSESSPLVNIHNTDQFKYHVVTKLTPIIISNL